MHRLRRSRRCKHNRPSRNRTRSPSRDLAVAEFSRKGCGRWQQSGERTGRRGQQTVTLKLLHRVRAASGTLGIGMRRLYTDTARATLRAIVRESAARALAAREARGDINMRSYTHYSLLHRCTMHKI